MRSIKLLQTASAAWCPDSRSPDSDCQTEGKPIEWDHAIAWDVPAVNQAWRSDIYFSRRMK